MFTYLFTFILFCMNTSTANSAPTKFVARDLPYAYDALAPQLSEETLRYHHDKHYRGYVDKLNGLLAGSPDADRTLEELIVQADGPLYNNAAQVWTHEFLFDELSPEPQLQPAGALKEAIDRDFGSVEQLKEQLNRAAADLFGSGWVWLVGEASGRLAIVSEPNAGNPLRRGLRPLLTIDVWEHAYYLDYRNRRADAVAALWERIDWRVIEERFHAR